MTKEQVSQEAELARLIAEGIDRARAEGRVIDRDTARRIAAAVHRGLGGELERFAATGKLEHHHTARLELFHTLKDEPRFAAWGEALRGFINKDARGTQKAQRPAKHQPKHKAAGRATNKPTATAKHAAHGSNDGPDKLLPQANPSISECETCGPEGVVVYVCNKPGDEAQRQGLALHTQHLACRRFTCRNLHKRLEATFADSARSQRAGLRRLLAHVAVCHNRRVVVQRLDRLLPGSPEAEQVAEDGARVLSATEQNTRSSRRQAALGRDVAALTAQDVNRGKTSKDSNSGNHRAKWSRS
ncbi:MAG: recombinase family protein [Propionibacteriaceae bacterium]|jgi:hypothetical protein|nr:recombinase family protein [Propionibacteriaceae bacterium]